VNVAGAIVDFSVDECLEVALLMREPIVSLRSACV